MNAVIALCHFCEVHGPSVIFCTQCIRNSGDIQINTNEEASCRSCVSLGPNVGLISKDLDGLDYISSQNSIATEATTILKQACVRSLSCEVSQSRDGGIVYFGDPSHGHVLSHTFQVPDAYSRGFYRWFSIIVIMKDKMFLLNLSPFISEHLQLMSKEIQDYARAVYNEEQSQCSQRALRLSTSQSTPPLIRSLPELTHKPNIFGYLHSKFTWLLRAGGSFYKERDLQIKPSISSPFVYTDTEEGFTLIHLNKSQYDIAEDNEMHIGLRDVKAILGSEIFNILCFCVLIGKQVIIRGFGEKVLPILNTMRCLFPISNRPEKIVLSEIYISAKQSPLLAVGLHVAVPQPCDDIFRIDITDDHYIMKWSGLLPEKYPTLLNKLHIAIDDTRLSDAALSKHITALIQEHFNTAMAIRATRTNTNEDLEPLYSILRIQPQDKKVIDHWCERYDHRFRNKIL